MFSYSTNGYNMAQVDEYISTLKRDYDKKLMELQLKLIESEKQSLLLKEELSSLSKKQKNAAFSLNDALEKARQIEASSKNIYELKVQQMNILYKRWNSLLNDIFNQFPEIENFPAMNESLQQFQDALEISDDEEESVITPVQTNNDSIRLLLNKMSKMVKKNEEVKEVKIERRPLFETPKTMIKPITDMTLEKGEVYENLVDKFLINENKKLVLQEDAFDLKKALNPTEDLEHIMKAFDFYPDNKK